MTTAVPAHSAAPHMTHTADPTATPQAQVAASADDARPSPSRLRQQIAENLLLSLCGGLILVLLTFFGTVVVALLIFNLTSINDRLESIEGRIDHLADRIDRLETKVDAGFVAQGAQIAELDRKLTALIAHLNATEAVDAALEHRLLIPGASALDSDGEPPG